MTYKRVPVKTHAEGDQQTSLFTVKNSNGNRIYFVAVDANTAFSMAENRRHVLNARNAIVYRVDLEQLAKRNPKFATSVRSAVRSRRQGVVQDKSGFAVMEDQVFMPIG